MGSRRVKIGPQTVAAMKPGDLIWDSEIRRFGARRRASGITYFVKARIDGRQRWLTIAKHGPSTPADARIKARHVLGEIDSGRDPTRERDGRRQIPLFADFAERWLREHVAVKRKASTAREYRRIIERHLNPALGKVRLDRINRGDAHKLHGDLAGQQYVANRVLAVLSAIMTYAERLELRPPYSNPARGVERFKERKRKRPLTIAELTALWAHLEEIEATTNPYIIAALRLLILTGMRREEVLTLRWDDVDLGAGVLRLRDAKTGPRDVMLSRRAIELLEALPEVDGNPFVFPGHKHGQRLVNITDRWQEIRAHLGFPDARIHDLRHSVASMLARTAPLTVVRDALGHREIGTTSGYSHAANDDVRAAVDSLASQIAGAR
jgi:integrase